MAAASSIFRECHVLLLLLFLALLLCVTSASSDVSLTSFPLPDMRSAHFHALSEREVQKFNWTHVDVRIPHPGHYSERLELSLVESATSWLEIKWRLVNGTGSTVDATSFSRVRCHLGNSTTTLHVFLGRRRQFRIPNLSSSTQYVVCVEVMEAASRYLHYTCSPFTTIPLVRPDSILGLVLTVGYFGLMILIGYVTWKMRVRQRVANQKQEGDMELSARTSTVHFSDIEERAHLNSNSASPGRTAFRERSV